MKLTDVKPVETCILRVRNPETGEYLMDGKVPVTITLKGTHTDAWQAELQRQIQKNKANEKRNVTKSPAQARSDDADLYASVTVAWTGIDGECGKETAHALYEPEHMAWLRRQVDEALREHSQQMGK